ncbi:MAG: flagellar assembly protein FliW [Deltaproteobacteria bacterium]|nr:flagellar assembly protein FliW [Deltaproteobacteria bacterium]
MKKNANLMLTIKTTRFGELSIDEKRVVQFPEGLLGFPAQKDYVILEHKPESPFFWLQSLTDADLAFVVIDPFLVKKDYLKELPSAEKRIFEGLEEGKVTVLALVTIRQGNETPITMNLMGPLVIDTETRTGKQIILANPCYTCKHPVKLS